MTEPDSLIDLAETCTRRALKAEWVGTHGYYCVRLECGHHAHPSTEFLRAQMLCSLCLNKQLTGSEPVDAEHVHAEPDDVYRWVPGMPYRWYVTSAEFVGGGMRHIIKRKRGRGTPDLLCNSFVTGYEVDSDGGRPCKRCLQRAAHLAGET